MILGAIYDALQFKSDTDHTHQISSVINLEASLTGKADLGHSHSISNIENLESSLSNKSNIDHTHAVINNTMSINGAMLINGDLSVSGQSTNIMSSIELTTPLSTFVSAGSTINYNFYRVKDSGNKAMFILSKDFVRGTDGSYEDYITGIYFYGPQTGAKNLPSGHAALQMKWRTGYDTPYLLLSTPTVGINEELTRVDYVKSKVKSGVPNRDLGVGIASDWPASGWTNTLGDGWIHVYLPVNKKSYIVQNEGTICLCQYTVDPTASDANGVNFTISHWMPVLSGKVYKVVDSVNGTSRAVDAAVWTPIKF